MQRFIFCQNLKKCYTYFKQEIFKNQASQNAING